ncbi:MAG: sulfatase [Bryobacteraceae bacterium]|nr:sulfatase [Bryobacteraceae bacterium]
MQRRTFLAAAGSAVATWAVSSDKPVNVVLIYADDLGYGDLGCYGGPLKTPHIDSLARDGVRFTNYYSANPVCSPSRASLLTGRYPTRVGVPKVFFPQDTTGLNKDEQTLADLLKARGYKTKCVGKWHLGSTPEYLPTRRGFDSYFGIPYSNDMTPRLLLKDEEVVQQTADLESLTQRYTEAAVSFIDSSAKSGPFFLYFPHTYPHIPLGASKRFRGKSSQGIYGDVLEELDWSVGEVLAALKRNGVEGNTLVLFSSDNGPWYQGSPGRLRGRKGSTLEGGVREPFLARLPGRIPKSRVVTGIASALDVVPTVSKLAGASLPSKPVDGIDIWPMLSGRVDGMEREALLYFDNVNLQCARWKNWKLHVARYTSQVYSPAPAAGRVNLPLDPPELYNLQVDADESYDVAAENPEIVKEIRARIDKLIPTFPDDIRKAWTDTLAKGTAVTPAGQFPRAGKRGA